MTKKIVLIDGVSKNYWDHLKIVLKGNGNSFIDLYPDFDDMNTIILSDDNTLKCKLLLNIDRVREFISSNCWIPSFYTSTTSHICSNSISIKNN